jgi:hypothetical protein
MACGRDSNDAQNRLFNERITSGFSDIPHNENSLVLVAMEKLE